MKYLKIFEVFESNICKQFFTFFFKKEKGSVVLKWEDIEKISTNGMVKIKDLIEGLENLELDYTALNHKVHHTVKCVPFYTLDWPIYIWQETIEKNINNTEFLSWMNKWKEILDKEFTKYSEFDEKCIQFSCKIKGFEYKRLFQEHRICIIKSKDNFYIMTDTEGNKKWFMCQGYDGLKYCLSNIN